MSCMLGYIRVIVCSIHLNTGSRGSIEGSIEWSIVGSSEGSIEVTII